MPPLTPASFHLADWTWDAASAAGTLLAVAVAFIAFLHQYRRENDQRLEANDQRKEANDQQRRAQAGYVSTWYDATRDLLYVENRSEQPIYDVGSTFARPAPAEGETPNLSLSVGGFLPFLGPHHRAAFQPRPRRAPGSPVPSPILAFRDSQGVAWRRDGSGMLVELDQPVLDYFGGDQAGDSNLVNGSPLAF